MFKDEDCWFVTNDPNPESSHPINIDKEEFYLVLTPNIYGAEVTYEKSTLSSRISSRNNFIHISGFIPRDG